jgi:hypothetical protein
MKNIILFSAVLILTQGCTSINQPTASRALVEQQYATQNETVAATLATALSNSKVGAVILIQEQPVVMGNKFFAATGLTCRKLSTEQSSQDIYCLNDQQDGWFKVNKVIAEYNENDFREADL